MTYRLRSIGLFLAAILCSPEFGYAQAPVTTTLEASGDTYLKGGTPNQNQGSAPVLHLQQSGPNRALVTFDQTQIANTIGFGSLQSAKLHLYVSANGGNWGNPASRTVGIHRMTGVWAEGDGSFGATWNSANDPNAGNSTAEGPAWEMANPTYWPFLATATATLTQGNNSGVWMEWDVTADVAAYLSGAANYGWMVKKEDETVAGNVDYASKEAASNRPELVLTYLPYLGPTPTPSPTPQPTIPPAVLTPSGDSFIKSGSANANQGAQTFLTLQQSGSNRALMQFNQTLIAAAVGSNTLQSAKLRLWVSSNGSNWGAFPGRPVSVHRMTQYWTELGVTWNSSNDPNTGNSTAEGSLWDMSNSAAWPFLASPTATVNQDNSSGVWMEWNVTADVAAFLAGTPNNGWIVKKDNEALAGTVDFASREGTNPPQLVVQVSAPAPPPPTPTPTVTPTPSVTATPTPTASPTATATPSATASPTLSLTPTPAVTNPFGPVTALNSNATLDSGDDLHPRTIPLANNQWAAVWSTTDRLTALGFDLGAEGDIVRALSSNSGQTWGNPTPVPGAGSDALVDVLPQTGPPLADTGTASSVIVWEAQGGPGSPTGGDHDIFFSKRDPGAADQWSAPAILTSSMLSDTGDDLAPQLITLGPTGSEAWVVFWHSNQPMNVPGGNTGSDFDIFYAFSVDQGSTWIGPNPANTNATNDSADDLFPQVGLSADGQNLVVVWQSKGLSGGTDWDIAFTRNGPDTDFLFTPPAPLTASMNTDTGDDLNPQILNINANGWLVTWESNEPTAGGIPVGNDFDIFMTAGSGSAWFNPIAVNANAATDSGDDRHPQLASDGYNLVLAWDSNDTLGGTKGSDSDILLSMLTLNTGGNWTYPIPLNSNAGTDLGEDLFPHVSTDKAGNWVVAWQSNNALGGGSVGDFDVYYATSSSVAPIPNSSDYYSSPPRPVWTIGEYSVPAPTFYINMLNITPGLIWTKAGGYRLRVASDPAGLLGGLTYLDLADDDTVPLYDVATFTGELTTNIPAGNYALEFQMEINGVPFGTRIATTVEVVPPNSQNTSGTNFPAQIGQYADPPPNFTIALQNISLPGVNWSKAAGYDLEVVSDPCGLLGGVTRLDLADGVDIHQYEVAIFTGTLSTNLPLGTCQLEFRMEVNGVPFGELIPANVELIFNPPTANLSSAPAANGIIIKADQTATFDLIITNTGSVPLRSADAYSVTVLNDDCRMLSSQFTPPYTIHSILSDIAPGNTYSFSLPLLAPDFAGPCDLEFQLVNSSGNVGSVFKMRIAVRFPDTLAGSPAFVVRPVLAVPIDRYNKDNPQQVTEVQRNINRIRLIAESMNKIVVGELQRIKSLNDPRNGLLDGSKLNFDRLPDGNIRVLVYRHDDNPWFFDPSLYGGQYEVEEKSHSVFWRFRDDYRYLPNVLGYEGPSHGGGGHESDSDLYKDALPELIYPDPSQPGLSLDKVLQQTLDKALRDIDSTSVPIKIVDGRLGSGHDSRAQILGYCIGDLSHEGFHALDLNHEFSFPDTFLANGWAPAGSRLATVLGLSGCVEGKAFPPPIYGPNALHQLSASPFTRDFPQGAGVDITPPRTKVAWPITGMVYKSLPYGTDTYPWYFGAGAMPGPIIVSAVDEPGGSGPYRAYDGINFNQLGQAPFISGPSGFENFKKAALSPRIDLTSGNYPSTWVAEAQRLYLNGFAQDFHGNSGRNSTEVFVYSPGAGKPYRVRFVNANLPGPVQGDGSYATPFTNIQAAIDDIYSEVRVPAPYTLGDGAVILVGGTYQIDAPLQLPYRVSLLGESPGSVILSGSPSFPQARGLVEVYDADTQPGPNDLGVGYISSSTTIISGIVLRNAIYGIHALDNGTLGSQLGPTRLQVTRCLFDGSWVNPQIPAASVPMNTAIRLSPPIDVLPNLHFYPFLHFQIENNTFFQCQSGIAFENTIRYIGVQDNTFDIKNNIFDSVTNVITLPGITEQVNSVNLDAAAAQNIDAPYYWIAYNLYNNIPVNGQKFVYGVIPDAADDYDSAGSSSRGDVMASPDFNKDISQTTVGNYNIDFALSMNPLSPARNAGDPQMTMADPTVRRSLGAIFDPTPPKIEMMQSGVFNNEGAKVRADVDLVGDIPNDVVSIEANYEVLGQGLDAGSPVATEGSDFSQSTPLAPLVFTRENTIQSIKFDLIDDLYNNEGDERFLVRLLPNIKINKSDGSSIISDIRGGATTCEARILDYAPSFQIGFDALRREQWIPDPPYLLRAITQTMTEGGSQSVAGPQRNAVVWVWLTRRFDLHSNPNRISIQFSTLAHPDNVADLYDRKLEALGTQEGDPSRYTNGVSLPAGATEGLDFIPVSSGTLNFDAALFSDSSNIVLPIEIPIVNDDIEGEDPEVFSVRLFCPDQGAGTGLIDQIVTIKDWTEGPMFSLSRGMQDVDEGCAAQVRVDLLPVSNQSKTISYRTHNLSAKAGEDYSDTSGQLSFPPNTTSQTITIPTIDNPEVEGDELFIVEIFNPSNEIPIGNSTTLVRIHDNPQKPIINLATGTQVVAENPAGGVVLAQVNLDRPFCAAVTVNYALQDGTAHAGEDYTGAVTPLVFQPGETQKTISVPIINDALDENDETFKIVLTGATNATLGTTVEQTVTITDNDPLPNLSFFLSGTDVNENAVVKGMLVVLAPASGRTVRVNYSTEDISAKSPADYTSVPPTILTFNPGETSKPESVLINDDTMIEPDETFKVKLTNPQNAVVSTPEQIITIHDDENNVVDFVNNGTNGWMGGLQLGTGTTSSGAQGLCMEVPAPGDNSVAWWSPENMIELVDNAVYRLRVELSTSQTATDAIPLVTIDYDNFQSSGFGNNYGGTASIRDVDGGANGIGRPVGRSSFDFYITPNAVATKQWRGTLNAAFNPFINSNSAFTPAADPNNDIRVIARVLDLDSSGIGAGSDFGKVCLKNLRVDRYNIDSLQTESVVFSRAINPALYFPQAFGQESSGTAEFRETTPGSGIYYGYYQINPTGIKTLGPWDQTQLQYPASVPLLDPRRLYPIQWISDALYKGTVMIRAEGSESDPVDAINLGFDTARNELSQRHYTTRGSSGNMEFAASPRVSGLATGNSAQPYIGFFYTQNTTRYSLIDPSANADRFRMYVEFDNNNLIGGTSLGADPFIVESLKIEKIVPPAP